MTQRPKDLTTRPPAVAGAFYPADPAELASTVAGFLNAAKSQKIENLKGVIAPHAGYPYSGKTAGVAYKQLSDLPAKSWRVFLLGPSHFAYVTASVGDFEAYETPLGRATVDRETCSELLKNAEFEFTAEAHTEEHCLEVQLPFLQQVLSDFQIVPILAGSIPPERLATILEKYFDQPENLFVISSDLSHHLPEKVAREKDEQSIKIITSLKLENVNSIDACGAVPIITALQLVKNTGGQIQLLDYTNSAESTGDTAAVVGYAAFAIS
ncbi:MAG: AmmeMemoRadiSam system protein B [Patescibacteria group bacterium]